MKYIYGIIAKLLYAALGKERMLYSVFDKYDISFYELKYYGYLHDTGWINSFRKKLSVDSFDNPIPWLTYPFMDFLEPRLNKNMVVFEYGSGFSSLYFSEKVSGVYSVESDFEWYKHIKTKSLPNLFIFHEPIEVNTSLYSNKPNELNIKFDIILIDGMCRSECLNSCISALNNDGVIIIDDAQVEENYESVLPKLYSLGFKRIDFWGIHPFVINKKTTAILYKANNILSI